MWRMLRACLGPYRPDLYGFHMAFSIHFDMDSYSSPWLCPQFTHDKLRLRISLSSYRHYI